MWMQSHWKYSSQDMSLRLNNMTAIPFSTRLHGSSNKHSHFKLATLRRFPGVLYQTQLGLFSSKCERHCRRHHNTWPAWPGSTQDPTNPLPCAPPSLTPPWHPRSRTPTQPLRPRTPEFKPPLPRLPCRRATLSVLTHCLSKPQACLPAPPWGPTPSLRARPCLAWRFAPKSWRRNNHDHHNC